MNTLVDLVKAVFGFLVVMLAWLAIQTFVRRRSGCGRDRDVLEFMLNGCGGCTGGGICARDKGKEQAECTSTNTISVNSAGRR